MCEHEGRDCPGRNCRCECMNCLMGDDEDDLSYPCSKHGPTQIVSQGSNPGFNGETVYWIRLYCGCSDMQEC